MTIRANETAGRKRFRVLFSQTQQFKIEVEARTPDEARRMIEDALTGGGDLDATAYGGDFDIADVEVATGEVA